MDVTATYATMSDLDIHIAFFEFLWLELLPNHLSSGSILVQAKPSLKLVARHAVSKYLRFRQDEKVQLARTLMA